MRALAEQRLVATVHGVHLGKEHVAVGGAESFDVDGHGAAELARGSALIREQEVDTLAHVEGAELLPPGRRQGQAVRTRVDERIEAQCAIGVQRIGDFHGDDDATHGTTHSEAHVRTMQCLLSGIKAQLPARAVDEEPRARRSAPGRSRPCAGRPSFSDASGR